MGRVDFGKYWKQAVGLLALGVLAACWYFKCCLGPGGAEQGRGANAEAPAAPEGYIQLEGSSSMEKLADALAEGFMEKYPGITVTVQFTGSSAGIRAVEEGRADIGISSRNLTEEERGWGLEESVAAIDGIAVCVDAGNPVTDITGIELADIYMGRISEWSALGGASLPIVVVGREAGSGTRESFEGLLGIRDRCTYANELDGTGAVMARVASTPGAIGYLSIDAVENGGGRGAVRALALDGIQPDLEHIRDGSYPLCRPFLMVTKGEDSAQWDLVQLWLQYVYSEDGREAVGKAGLATP